MADELQAPDSGQDQTPAAPDTSVAPESGQGGAEQGQAEASAPEHFHRYTHDDGTEHVFKDQDELNRFLRDGILRHSDYTKKTQEVADQRKQLEQLQQQLQQDRSSLTSMSSQYEQFKNFLDKRPDVVKRIKEEMQQKGQSASIPPEIQEKLSKVDEMEKALKEREEAEQDRQAREKAFSRMGQMYPDFDRKVVESEIKRLQEMPPGDEHFTLAELAHFAALGRKKPAELESQIAERLKQKSASPRPMPSGGAAPKGPASTGRNFDEAARLAKQELGG
jgi:antitoxin component HigA of HigAB toxin-antitoxin module